MDDLTIGMQHCLLDTVHLKHATNFYVSSLRGERSCSWISRRVIYRLPEEVSWLSSGQGGIDLGIPGAQIEILFRELSRTL